MLPPSSPQETLEETGRQVLKITCGPNHILHKEYELMPTAYQTKVLSFCCLPESIAVSQFRGCILRRTVYKDVAFVDREARAAQPGGGRYRFTSQSIIYIRNLIRPYICNISNRSLSHPSRYCVLHCVSLQMDVFCTMSEMQST
ncbi:hypothetical protein N1851_027721 [Merluccius polli]|uniref:Uncharacterized protein n=1 Tax=Merluccius polli TaxID=89951 RepID=A0AA47M9Y3_MERPO|nr:hypothetical protein N1851_027721 [Merluccius polli]